MRKKVAREMGGKFRFVETDILFVVRLFVAFLLIIIGVIGLLFPVIPDWPLIIVGIVILDARGKTRRWMIKKMPRRWREKAHKLLFNKFFKKFGGGELNNG